MARTILVSASDATFFPLLEELHASVEQGVRQDGLDIGALDVGFAPGQRETLEKRGVLVREAAHDYPPSIFRTAPKPFFRAMTARPHLPRYFPGYDLYLFLDADCWVQDWEAARLYLSAAQAKGLAVTPELDRSYSILYSEETVAEWRLKIFRLCFAEAIARKFAAFPLINTGLFAARADSAVWEKWSVLLGNLYQSIGEPLFYAEQFALNAIVRSAMVPAALLPARCNWMCNRSAPMTREGGTVLCEPEPPHAPLGIVHITGPDKDRLTELTDVDGTRRSRSLRYRPISPGQPI